MSANVCPPMGTITGTAADIMTTNSIDLSSFTGPIELSSDINFNVYHKVINEKIHLVLESQDTTNRWLGFGFAEQQSGHMKGSDLVTISVSDDAIKLDDRYATFVAAAYDNTTGIITYDGLDAFKDEYNDWSLEETYQATSLGIIKTQVHISRSLDTGDNQDRPIGLGARQVVWAYGSDTTVAYHEGRGTTMIEFRPIPEGTVSPDGSKIVEIDPNDYDGKWSLQMDYWVNPDNGNTEYVCQSFILPNDTKRSIRAIEYNLNQSTLGFPHHAIVHICQDNAYFHGHQNAKLCGNTGSSPLGDSSSGCAGLIATWAAGMQSQIMPVDVGFPVGPNEEDLTYVIVEMHYDNPRLEKIYDDFSINFYYDNSPTLYDAATMTVGDPLVRSSAANLNSPFETGLIPAGEKDIHRQGTCVRECTEEFSGSKYVFDVFLHMHIFGHKITLERYDSEKTFIEEKARIDFWENGFQHNIHGDAITFTWEPGEALHLNCFFDNTRMNADLSFGSKTSDEMCMAFIYYYPREFRGNSSSGAPLELSNCGAFAGYPNSQSVSNICGSLSINPSKSSNMNAFDRGDSSSQIDSGSKSYADPSSFMETQSTHICIGQTGEEAFFTFKLAYLPFIGAILFISSVIAVYATRKCKDGDRKSKLEHLVRTSPEIDMKINKEENNDPGRGTGRTKHADLSLSTVPHDKVEMI